MPEVKRSEAKKPLAAPAKKVLGKQPLTLSLPTELSQPADDVNQFHVCIMGEPGVGKTTIGMQQENVLLLTFDPFKKSLKCFQRHVPSWKHATEYLKLLEEAAANKTFKYTRVLIDGVDIMWRLCQKDICIKLAIEHPADEAYGKGWDKLATTFTDVIDRLLALPCGVWFIFHSRDKEVENREGTKVEKHAPYLTARAEEIVVGKSDALFTIRYRGKNNRVMNIRGSESVSAKCNIDGHFLTPTGERISEIVLGDKGPEEAWRRLLKAYNNEQKYVDYEGWRALVSKPAPKKGASTTN